MSVLLYALAALGALIALGVATTWIKVQLARRKALTALAKVYAALPQQPTLQVQLFYGYPAFTVSFRNHPALEDAARRGMNEEFLREIDRLFAGHGPKSRPFRAEAAVRFTHKDFLTRADVGLQ
jgi:hypothetical protein